MSAARTRRLVVLVASLVLLGTVGGCIWGTWAMAQPGVATFVPSNAIDLQRHDGGFGVERLTFRYNGSLRDERLRLTTVALDGGWEYSHLLNDCSRYCTPYKATYLYVRNSWFGTLREIVVINQSGNGPYAVSVTFKRCIILPQIGCWPQ